MCLCVCVFPLFWNETSAIWWLKVRKWEAALWFTSDQPSNKGHRFKAGGNEKSMTCSPSSDVLTPSVYMCVSSCKPLCKSGLHPANGAAEKGTEIQAFVWPTSHRFHMSCSPEVNYLQEQCDWSRSAAFRQPLIRCVWFQGVFRARLKQFAWPLLCRIDSFNHTVWCSFMARVGCILHWYEDIITATEHRIWPKLQKICKDPY